MHVPAIRLREEFRVIDEENKCWWTNSSLQEMNKVPYLRRKLPKEKLKRMGSAVRQFRDKTVQTESSEIAFFQSGERIYKDAILADL